MAKNCDQGPAGRTQGSLGQARASVPEQSCIPPTHFLIANPELEFHVNPIRISELKFPNRKFSTIFHLPPHPVRPSLPITRHPSLASDLPWPPWRLIETPRLEFLATPTKQKSTADSNRDRKGVFEPASCRHSRFRSAQNSLRDSVPLWPSQSAASRATLTLQAPQSNLAASCFVRAPLGEHS